MKCFVFVQLLITVVSCFGISNVLGNEPLKKRVNTLEMRVNSIEIRVNTDNTLTRTNIDALERDIDSLNISLSVLEDQVCPPKESSENQRHSMLDKSRSKENDNVLNLSKNVLLAGFADEKKWLRGKAEEIQNELNENLSVIKSDISNYKREIDVTAEELQNKMNESLSVIKSDVRKFKKEIDVLATENDKKIENLKKHMNDEMDVKINKTEANIKKYVASVISEMNQTFDFKIKKLLETISLFVCNKKFGKFCYVYFSSTRSYNPARTECSLMGATVADIESQAENDFLIQFARNNGHVWGKNYLWIGITDEDVEDEWISDRTRSKAKFLNMRSNQPDGGTEQNCMVLGYDSPYDKWNDWPCSSYNYNFICKKEL